jgi:hypothetical protein
MKASNNAKKTSLSKEARHTKNKSVSPAIKTKPERVSPDGAFSEIRFDNKTNIFFATLALYVLLTTCFNINGSSVGMWDQALNSKTDNHILIGTPKGIRVDEWGIQTPAILSQCNSTPPFSTENYSFGRFKAPLLMGVPVKHFSTLLRPQFWLFFLVGPERAFAFFWNMKLAILMAGVFLLLMLILKNDFGLAVFGALWVYFSGYVQWWYSNWPELIGFFALFTAAFIQILVSRRKITVVLSSFLFLIAFFNFAISLQPGLQVPLGYLSGCIVIGVLLPRFRTILSELVKDRFQLTVVILTLALTAGLLFLFYCDAKQTMKALADTVFPGSRRSPQGGISIVEIFSGFFGIFMSEKHFPNIWGNICELSSFFLFFPIPMMLMCWEWLHRKKISALDAIFAIYITVILLWQVCGFPPFLAQATLFDRVPGTRSFLALGLASVFWTCLCLHRMLNEKTLYAWKFKISVTAIMLIGVAIYAYSFNIVTDDFASFAQILMVCVFVPVAGLLLMSRKTLLFAGLILIPNMIAYGMVNPICIGLKPILNNPLYNEIHQMTRQNPDSKWVVYGNLLQLADFTYATGAKVFNGLKLIPNLDEMKVLSSKNADVDIYNSYGYIGLLPAEGSEIKFSLSDGRDHYMISVNPENDCWKQLGITYCMFPTRDGLRINKYSVKP